MEFILKFVTVETAFNVPVNQVSLVEKGCISIRKFFQSVPSRRRGGNCHLPVPLFGWRPGGKFLLKHIINSLKWKLLQTQSI